MAAAPAMLLRRRQLQGVARADLGESEVLQLVAQVEKGRASLAARRLTHDGGGGNGTNATCPAILNGTFTCDDVIAYNSSYSCSLLER